MVTATAPAAGDGVSTTPPTPRKAKPRKKRSLCKLPLEVMKKLDQDTPLTYHAVLDHGGDVTHWKRWLRDRQKHRWDSPEDHYRYVVAINDLEGCRAVDNHRRRQKLKDYSFFHGDRLWDADRRRMVAAMRAHGTPTDSEVTVRREQVTRNYNGEFIVEERYRFLTECPVAEHMLACLGDDIDMLRAEAATTVMEACGVVVERAYPAECGC